MPPAESVRILHFADVHLGVETHGRFNPETGLNTRLEDFSASLHQAVDLALARDVDLAVFAGDAYKARDPSQTHQKLFAAALRKLTDQQIPVVMLVGNHDIPNTRGRAHALEIFDLLSGRGVQILAKPEVLSVETRRGSVLVAGMPYLLRASVLRQEETRGKTVEEIANFIRDKYISYVSELAARCSEQPESIAILTAHFTVRNALVGVQGMLVSPAEPQVPVERVALPQFDYVAMGHIHKYQICNNKQQPPVVYPGSIDRIDFGEKDENKGFVIVDIRKRDARIERIDLQTRAFLEINLDASHAEDPTAYLLAELEKRPIADAVIKVSYKIPREKLALVREDEIRKALSVAHTLVALSRELPGGSASTRSEGLTESVTPQQALALYLDNQPRLLSLRDDLVTAAQRLLDEVSL
jgi:DNA repair protein SbcD/Mre11